MITDLSEELYAGLARISGQPVSSGLGHGLRIAAQACELCVTAFADFCAIYLRSAGPSAAAFACRDSLKFGDLGSLSYDDLLIERAGAAATGTLFEEPLLVGGRQIGTLVLGASDAETLAKVGRAAMPLIATILATSIDQAEELEHHYRVSKRLQKAMLPARLVHAEGHTFDAAYRPASDEADVGGDWYDAFDLGGGKIGISVGDVTGHGLEAAVAMSEIRRALRAAAATTDSPKALLNYVDGIVSAEGIGMATAIVGVYDVLTNVLRYASAGHPPPVLLSASKRAQFLPGGGLLLGLGGNPASDDYTVTLSPGTSCFFYTDGLLEYSRDVIAGERALLAALERIAIAGMPTADALHAEIFSEIINTDDSATLALHHSEALDGARERLEFSGIPICASLARESLRHFCERNAIFGERQYDVLSCVGEAVANAIEHGTQGSQHTFIIDLDARTDELVASVDSFGHWRMFTPRDERGRGIPIMRSCSKRLEISSTHERTRITLTFDRL
ncbi:MAG: SpoIIE family protein phosphatase [Candidatus Eremiobacteraeota bacterium]|nr:SpoIIE family protein phosphatase [Candidatus Eremiobacteraeota bacterium]